MDRENAFDLMIREDLRMAADGITDSGRCKEKIDARIARAQIEFQNGGRKKMTVWTMKRVATTVAVCCLMIGTAVLAAGKITSVYSHNDFGSEITNYEELESLEKEAGFEVLSQEDFLNGFVFDSGEIVETEGQDEERNTVKTWKEISLQYKDADGRTVFIEMEPEEVLEQEIALNALESRTIQGTEVYYDCVEYLSVPASYRPTAEEEKRNEEDPQFTIGYGAAEEPTTMYSSSVQFARDGVRYIILTFSETDAEELFSMAEQLLGGK